MLKFKLKHCHILFAGGIICCLPYVVLKCQLALQQGMDQRKEFLSANAACRKFCLPES